MNDVLLIKTYVDLTVEQYDAKSEKELYEAVRGTWRVNENKIKDLKYVFAIHKGIIKAVYIIDSWHKANTTKYYTRKLNENSTSLNNRFEFVGRVFSDKSYFIGFDISNYYVKGEANPIKYMTLNTLENLYSKTIVYPDDIQNNDLIEGAKKQISVNAYERNNKARQACLNKFGYTCSVCGFDFEKIYGEIGRNFIHVHHIKPLKEINEEYIINPEKDLIPVCPNCHAMLHKKKECYTIEEIKDFIKENKLSK